MFLFFLPPRENKQQREDVAALAGGGGENRTKEAYLLAGVENTPRMMSRPCILMTGLVECSRLK